VFRPVTIWWHSFDLVGKFKMAWVAKFRHKFTTREAIAYYEPKQPEIFKWFADGHRAVCVAFFFMEILPVG
jgi:hypothetical protein